MSIISASTTLTTGLQYTSDTTGTLVFKTGSTPTTALTIGADQSATFAGTVNFAAAGFTNLSYTGTLTGGTGVVNLGSGQFYKDSSGNINIGTSGYTATKVTSVGATGAYGVLRYAPGTSASPATDIALGYIQLNNQVYANISFLNSITSDNATWMTFNVTPTSSTTPVEAMRINSAGNVGIGNASPGYPLDIYRNAASIVKIRGGSSTNQGGGYYVWKSDNSGSLCAFGDYANQLGGTPDTLASIYTAGGIPLVFSVAGAERMRITSAGALLLGTTTTISTVTVAGSVALYGGAGQGNSFFPYYNSATSYNAVSSDNNGGMTFITGVTAPTLRATITNNGYLQLSAASGGIQFNGDTSSANALNDYEEGTWTPSTSTSGVTVTSIANAYYVKIGKFVLAYAYFTVSSASGTTAAAWTGLPFASLGYGPASRYYGTNSFTESAYIESGATFIIDNGDVPAGVSGIMISAYYRTT